MGEQLVIRGVPTRIAMDAWWFTDDANTQDGDTAQTRPDAARLPPPALGALAGLTVLADLLFWDTDLGVSVALYALALSACMLALKPGGVTRREALIAMSAVVACALPVVELVQPLSLLFCGAGVAGVLVWVTLGPSPKLTQTIDMIVDLTFIGPFRLPMEAAQDLRRATSDVDIPALARATALPLVIGVLFIGLFTVANPLLETALKRVASFNPLSPDQIIRPLFWVIGACLVWPILQAHARWTNRPHTSVAFTWPSTMFINASSVRSSLILFNVLFAVQTLSDVGVLTGGVTLPEGMTYAEYAHRGAYPLLVTAVLSGLFAIATHRMVVGNALLRGLMFVWLGQTLFLVITAAIRLGAYVEAYSLTHMRIAAFIWMALIFTGLVLILVQLIQDRSFGWLLKTNLIVATGTLYLCCFMNFAYLITDYNMTHTPPDELDLAYLCALGEQVIPAMMDYGQITDQTACGHDYLPALRFDPIETWQEWGFRRWRLQRYLTAYHDL